MSFEVGGEDAATSYWASCAPKLYAVALSPAFAAEMLFAPFVVRPEAVPPRTKSAPLASSPGAAVTSSALPFLSRSIRRTAPPKPSWVSAVPGTPAVSWL